jgi:DNA-binding NarL/FixJ family response regulator
MALSVQESCPFQDLEESMATLSELTEREMEILRLLLVGRTNKAIAAKMCISEKTVEFHLDKIYTKIGMRTRMLAGMWAMQQGMGSKAREIHHAKRDMI